MTWGSISLFSAFVEKENFDCDFRKYFTKVFFLTEIFSACVTKAEKGLFSRKLTRRVCLIQHEGERSLAAAMYARYLFF